MKVVGETLLSTMDEHLTMLPCRAHMVLQTRTCLRSEKTNLNLRGENEAVSQPSGERRGI
jgi:hypothetical protein